MHTRTPFFLRHLWPNPLDSHNEAPTVDLTGTVKQVNEILREEDYLAPDQDAILARIRELYAQPYPNESDNLLLRILVRRLDERLSTGGPQPSAWQHADSSEVPEPNGYKPRHQRS